jgi:hypothetical protein
MDQDTLDVAGPRRTGVKDGVSRTVKLRPIVGILYARHDVVGIEQHHEMLRQIGERIDDQFVLGEQHGTGLSDTDDRSDDRHIDIRQIMRLFDFVEPTITGNSPPENTGGRR